MAHMPTYYAAAGREVESRTTLTSIKDQAGQMKLKYRKSGQSTSEEIGDREKVLEHLKKKESKELSKKDSALSYVINEEKKVLLITDAPAAVAATKVASVVSKYDDTDAGTNGGAGDGDDGFDSSSDEESDDEDDDEAELQAELERIRAERAAAKERKEEEERKEQESKAYDEAKIAVMRENGGEGESARVKRRWNDDVVFRNQATEEGSKKPRFINDPLRSDFHRKFMRKYLK
jgi:protein CWC15